MISLCVPFYPWYRAFCRREEIFDVLIPSLNAMDGGEELELCVSDGGSEDVWKMHRKHDSFNFMYRIKNAFKGKVQFDSSYQISVTKHVRWWLAKSISKAVEISTGSHLFIIGMDYWLPQDFIYRYHANVSEGSAWVVFPAGLKAVEDQARFWKDAIPKQWHTAKGIVGITKKDYDKIGGYNYEQYVKDHSDSNFYHRMHSGGLAVTEKREIGFFHINHPGSHFRAIY